MALQRFLYLLAQYGTAGETALWQAGSAPVRRAAPILLDYRDIERVSGVQIAIERARDILVSLGFKVELVQEQKIAAISPWWRMLPGAWGAMPRVPGWTSGCPNSSLGSLRRCWPRFGPCRRILTPSKSA